MQNKDNFFEYMFIPLEKTFFQEKNDFITKEKNLKLMNEKS